MSDSVFGQTYADQYDFLYGDKDYEAECDLIEGVFRRYGQDKAETILDLGCGTGNHAIPLARRGYQITGVDLSADMLAHAREKAVDLQLPAGRVPPAFVLGDLRDLNLGRQYDAILMMFAVLGYQLTNSDVVAALDTVSRHLRPGGLFICDVWYGPAVLAIRPSDRVKIVPVNGIKVVRAAQGRIDTLRHLAEVRYHIWRIRGDRVLMEDEEIHQLRFFFPQELSLYFTHAGLELVDLCAFDAPGQACSEATWDVLCVGKRGQGAPVSARM